MLKETSPILHLNTSISNILNRRGKKLSVRPKNGLEKIIIIGAAKRDALTLKNKNFQRFLKTGDVYSTGVLSELILWNA